MKIHTSSGEDAIKLTSKISISEKVFGKAGAKRRIKEADLLLKELFPICRSLTGDGVRETLARLREVVDFDVHEVPSGTRCYDWEVPLEWNIKNAFILDEDGNVVIDFKNNNLHVVNYSIPIDQVITFKQLDEHLHSMPELPDAIPYRTSYYNKNWGFCLSERQRRSLDRNKKYHVKIDSTLAEGSLSYGEGVIRGKRNKEYLISSYCCHPSMANDSLSGIILWTLLLRDLKDKGTVNNYRFVIAPETIGTIAYLSRNEALMKNVSGGFVITTVGGPGDFGYKETFKSNSLIDRVAMRTFAEEGITPIVYPFDINGSDEARYSSPFFRIPVGTISKDKYYEYDYYHTSLDSLDFVKAEALVESLALYTLVIQKLELDSKYISLHPYCEPMLGKRGLYPTIGGQIHQKVPKAHESRVYSISSKEGITGRDLDAIKWLMFYSDGDHSLMDIAELSGLNIACLGKAASILTEHKLLRMLK